MKTDNVQILSEITFSAGTNSHPSPFAKSLTTQFPCSISGLDILLMTLLFWSRNIKFRCATLAIHHWLEDGTCKECNIDSKTLVAEQGQLLLKFTCPAGTSTCPARPPLC